MKLVAGVDGGSTKTLAAVCDLDGELRGVGREGGSNWESVGVERAARVITGATEAALAMAGGSLGDLVHGHMTLAGVDWPEDVPRMEKTLRQAGWGCPLMIENDAFGTLRACSPEGYGIGTTAGSGVCCCVIQPDGEKYFYGAFTDMGGGIDIDGHVVQAVLRSYDGRGSSTMLTEALLEATGHETVLDLAYDMHRRGNSVSKRVTDPILFGCANRGDAVAIDIVTRFGRELALAASTLIRRYGLADSDPVVAAAGALFLKTGSLLFDVFGEAVLETAPRARLIRAKQPPVMGAVRGALEAVGIARPEVWDRVRRTATERGWFREDMGAEPEGADNGK